MIYFADWRLDATGDIIARQYDNQSRTITISGALPEGWTWELLVRAGNDAYDEWPMAAQDGGISCTLTAEMLAVSGYYTLQLRGKQGEAVRHTNTIRVFIPESLSGDAQWPELPTAFSDAVDRAEDAADRAEAAAVRQPMISDAKTWLVWDADKGEYVDTGVSAGGGENAVLYTEQNLDDSQKLQARRNIGAFPGKNLFYFFDTKEGSEHDDDIFAAYYHGNICVICPGNIYTDGNGHTNSGMAFPAYVLRADWISSSTYQAHVIDANACAWDIIYYRYTGTDKKRHYGFYSIKRIATDSLCVKVHSETVNGVETWYKDREWDEITQILKRGGYVYVKDGDNNVYPLAYYEVSPEDESRIETVAFRAMDFNDVGVAGFGFDFSIDGKIQPFLSVSSYNTLGLTSAKAGQVPVVSAVDNSGVPTEWEARKALSADEAGDNTDIPTLGFLQQAASQFYYEPFPLGIEGAKAGQIAKIAEVDGNGMPTAWSPVDMPDGGGSAWQKLAEITLDADTRSIVVSQTDDGEAFSVNELYVYTNATNIAANTTNANLAVLVNDKNVSTIGTTAAAGITLGKTGETGRNWLYLKSLCPLIVFAGSWLQTNTTGEKTVYCWQPDIFTKSANPFAEDEKISKITLSCLSSTSTFASGSKFIIWGR